MQVQRHDDWNLVADDIANAPNQFALAVGIVFSHHRSMKWKHYSIEAIDVLSNTVEDLPDVIFVRVFLNYASWCGKDGDRLD